jgi:hypothetical protein
LPALQCFKRRFSSNAKGCTGQYTTANFCGPFPERPGDSTAGRCTTYIPESVIKNPLRSGDTCRHAKACAN